MENALCQRVATICADKLVMAVITTIVKHINYMHPFCSRAISEKHY